MFENAIFFIPDQKICFCTFICMQALQTYNYDDDPMLAACCVSIEKQPVEVDGRVLETPKVNFNS